MSTEQTTSAHTNNKSQTVSQTVSQPVSFDDVSLETLRKSFNDTYKVSKGSASNIVCS